MTATGMSKSWMSYIIFKGDTRCVKPECPTKNKYKFRVWGFECGCLGLCLGLRFEVKESPKLRTLKP